MHFGNMVVQCTRLDFNTVEPSYNGVGGGEKFDMQTFLIGMKLVQSATRGLSP